MSQLLLPQLVGEGGVVGREGVGEVGWAMQFGLRWLGGDGGRVWAGCGHGVGREWAGCGQGVGREWAGCEQGVGREWSGCGQGAGREWAG